MRLIHAGHESLKKAESGQINPLIRIFRGHYILYNFDPQHSSSIRIQPLSKLGNIILARIFHKRNDLHDFFDSLYANSDLTLLCQYHCNPPYKQKNKVSKKKSTTTSPTRYHSPAQPNPTHTAPPSLT